MQAAKENNGTISNGYIILDLENIKHEKLINSTEYMTAIPAKILSDTVSKSKVLMISMEGKLKYVLFSVYADNKNNSSNFTGKIIIRDLNGSFRAGYKYENGIITAYLVPKKTADEQNAKPMKVSANDEIIDGGTFNEVVCTADSPHPNTIPLPYIYNSGPFWEGTTSRLNKACYSIARDDTGGRNEIQERTDCTDDVKKNAEKINDILTDNKYAIRRNSDGTFKEFTNQGVNENAEKLRDFAKNSQFEWGMCVNYNDGSYYTLKDKDFASGNFATSTSLKTSYDLLNYTENTVIVCHSHPNSNGNLYSPSPGDAVFLGKAFNDIAKNIYANIVFSADGSEYAVYVSDREAFETFCKNAANAGFFAKTTDGYFQAGTSWANDYNTVFNNLWRDQGFSQTDANSYALTHVLDKYNTGIKIAERNSKTEQFKEQKTDADTSYDKTNYQPKKCP